MVIDVLFSCGLAGGHPGGVCAPGEETQDSGPGAQRPGYHHRHWPEGEEACRMARLTCKHCI